MQEASVHGKEDLIKGQLAQIDKRLQNIEELLQGMDTPVKQMGNHVNRVEGIFRVWGFWPQAQLSKKSKSLESGP